MKKKVWTVCIIICVFAAVYAAVSIWISCNYLVVRNFRQESAEISGEIRFVVLSDLHDHQFGKNNEELIEKVSQQHPDFILMDGDMLNDTSSDAEVVCSLIEAFGKRHLCLLHWEITR